MFCNYRNCPLTYTEHCCYHNGIIKCNKSFKIDKNFILCPIYNIYCLSATVKLGNHLIKKWLNTQFHQHFHNEERLILRHSEMSHLLWFVSMEPGLIDTAYKYRLLGILVIFNIKPFKRWIFHHCLGCIYQPFTKDEMR